MPTPLIAIHNFKGDQPGDLPFAKHEKLIGLELKGDWWTGKNEQGKLGSFPTNYVKEAAADTSPSAGSTKTTAPNQSGAAFASKPNSGPVHRTGSTESATNSAPTTNYGDLSGGQDKDKENKTRTGLTLTVRGLQVLTSLFALAFMGATTQGMQYSYSPESIDPDGNAPAGSLPSNDGVKMVLAMSVIGWLESSVFLIVAVLCVYNIAGVRQKFDANPNRFLITFAIDCLQAWLTLIAVTICPTERLIADRRAIAAAVFLMMYLMILFYSILMSYKDMTKLKLIDQGWIPPSTTASVNVQNPVGYSAPNQPAPVGPVEP